MPVKDAQKHVDKVVGVTFEGRQNLLAHIFETFDGDISSEVRQTVEVPGTLEREPDNAYDKKAIKVIADGEQIGYLNRENAAFIYDRGLSIYPDRILVRITQYVSRHELEPIPQYSATVEFYTANRNVKVEDGL